MVFTDYDHVGHYLRNAIALFQTIRRKNADWVNLANLWLLRNCIRENYNHGIGIEDMIFGNDVETLQPMTKQRLFAAAKEIQRRDKYATLQNIILQILTRLKILLPSAALALPFP